MSQSFIVKKRRKASEKAFYVDNHQFYKDLVEFSKQEKEAELAGTELPRVPECIGKAIFDIARNFANLHSFRGYSYVDEMVSDAVEVCLKYVRSFDPEKSTNPYGYFTRTIHRAFIRRINEEEKSRYSALKFTSHTALLDQDLLINSDGDSIVDNEYAVHVAEYMDKWEKKEEARKERRLKKKEGLPLDEQ